MVGGACRLRRWFGLSRGRRRHTGFLADFGVRLSGCEGVRGRVWNVCAACLRCGGGVSAACRKWVRVSCGQRHIVEGRVRAMGADGRDLSSMVLVAPISSTDNGFPLHISIGEVARSDGRRGVVEGFAQIERVRAIDPAARKVRKVAEVSSARMQEVTRALLETVVSARVRASAA